MQIPIWQWGNLIRCGKLLFFGSLCKALTEGYVLFLMTEGYVLFLMTVGYVLFLMTVGYVLFLITVGYVSFLINDISLLIQMNSVHNDGHSKIKILVFLL